MQPFPHQQPFFAQPLALLAIALSAGILGARFIPVSLNPNTLVPPNHIPPCLISLSSISLSLIPLLIFCALATLLALASALRQRLRLSTASLTIAFTLSGASLALIEKQQVRPDGLKEFLDRGVIAVGEPVELTGVLNRPPETAPASLYFTMRAEQVRYKGNEKQTSGVISLMVPIYDKATAEEYQKLELRYGARVRLMTTLRRTDNYRNPGVSSFTEFLERKGYDATGFIKSPLLIERLNDDRVFLPLAWLYERRSQLETQIRSHFSPEAAGVINASLLGNRYYLSRPTAERFRDGGTFHVLVISGWHISVIGGLIFLIARRFTRKKGWQFLLSAIVLWGYALAVGAEASVVRAALMFTLLTLAPVIGRRGASLNTLGAAGLLLLVWRPSSLFDPSFQLTFLSVMAIVVLAWPLLAKMSAIGSWRPTRETPHPPSCAPWLRSAAELLFWSERKWKKEMEELTYNYKVIKDPRAALLENFHLQRPLRYAFASVVVSFSVQLTLLPLLVVYFHRLSISSLILNVGVSLLMALLSLTALAALIVTQVSLALAGPLIGLTNALNWLMVHCVDPFAWLGIASLRLPEYSGWGASIYVLYYVTLIGVASALSRWDPFQLRPTKSGRVVRFNRVALLAHSIPVALILFHPLSEARADGRLRVDFLDVGQGDAALVTMPDGTTLLVDGGGRPNFMSRKRASGANDEEPFERDTRSIGEAVVSEYLWWRGLDRVDYVLATHMDADHVDGLNDVMRNFKVRAALVSRRPPADPEFKKFNQTARAQGVPINLIGRGDVLKFGNSRARVLWPSPSKSLPSRNNDSIILRLDFGKRKILLTGDVERAGETALLNSKRTRNYLAADVVKAPHHGSKSSSNEAFVKATGARYSIISVGQTSIFGHPHKEVVERWQRSGAEVLTTGTSGMITVTTDGGDLRVRTFMSDKL